MCVERVLSSCFCTFDIFLSVGLSHRVHHVLPYQQLGFANIASQPIIMETCKEFSVEWEDCVFFGMHRRMDFKF